MSVPTSERYRSWWHSLPLWQRLLHRVWWRADSVWSAVVGRPGPEWSLLRKVEKTAGGQQ